MLFGSTKNSLKKKFSSFFEIFLAKKILRLERSEKRYDFSKLFPSFLLSSRIALKSLSSSLIVFSSSPVVSQKEEEEECLERLLRRAHDVTTKKRERERERENLFFFFFKSF